MLHRLSLIVAIAAVLGPLACADSTSPPAADGSADAGVVDAAADQRLDDGSQEADGLLPADAEVVAPADYCERIAPALCDFYLRCGRIAAADETACHAAVVETCNARYEPVYRSLVDAGLLELSSEAVRACVAHLPQVACAEQLHDLDGPCAMWTGRQPAGRPCGLGIESLVCAPDTECVLGLDLCGTCRRLAATGEPCGSATTQEVTCGAASSCRDGLCEPRGRPGDACDDQQRCLIGLSCGGGHCAPPQYAQPGEACDAQRRCPYLSTCIGGVCRANARLGQPCGAGVVCDGGRCLDGLCAARAPAGTPCGNPGDCISGNCAGSTCAAIPGACF